MIRIAACLFGLLWAVATSARAEEGLRLFAAGSLVEAMTAMLVESELPQDQTGPRPATVAAEAVA